MKEQFSIVSRPHLGAVEKATQYLTAVNHAALHGIHYLPVPVSLCPVQTIPPPMA